MKQRHVLRWLTRCSFALLAAAQSLSCAIPIDVPLARLHQTVWTNKDGAPDSGYSIAQTKDGWMWFGTADGLYRFDGASFEREDTDASGPSRSRAVRSLLALDSGELVMGYQNGGVGILRDGKVVDYGEADGFDNATVFDLVTDANQHIWAATRTGLHRFDGRRWQRLGSANGLPSGAVYSTAIDNDGRVWISLQNQIYFLDRGSEKFAAGPVARQMAALVQDRDGRIWYQMDTDMRLCPFQRVAGAGQYVVPKAVSDITLFDQDGVLWTDTDIGLLRTTSSTPLEHLQLWAGSSAQGFRKALGDEAVLALSSPAMTLLQQHGGALWMTTVSGTVMQLRAVPIEPARATVGFEGTGAIAATPDGGVWLSVQSSVQEPSTGDGLWRVDGQAALVQPADIPYASLVHTSNDGTLWVAGGGKLWRRSEHGFVHDTDLPFSDTVNAVVGMANDQDSHSIWVSIYGRGLFLRRGSEWQRNGGISALPDSEPKALAEDAKGSVWFGYSNGRIVEVSGSRVLHDSSAADAQVGAVRTISAGRYVLVGGDRGVAVLRDGKFTPLTTDEPTPIEAVTGIVESRDGDVWINARRGLVRIAASELDSALRSGATGVEVRIFDSTDGYPSTGASKTPFGNTITRAADGAIWFAAQNRVGVLYPKAIRPNSTAPLVLRSLTSPAGRIAARGTLTLLADTQSLQIDYTALDYEHPDRERFRYRLIGLDDHWTNAGPRRQAFFTNLGPGHYRFEVESRTEAVNWQELPVTMEIDVPPTFLQSRYFIALCALAGMLALTLVVRAREHQLRHRERLKTNERLAERERIARELHDTLLQSTQGLALKVHAVAMRIKPGELTRRMLDEALKDADLLMIEGRDRIQTLRLHEAEPQQIETLLRRLGCKLADEHGVGFDIAVHGTGRELAATVAHEAHRIGSEAMLNAFRHARASRVETELLFASEDFRIRIRDNGIGIDPQVLRAGHAPGRWGLRGMRERALRAGGTLDVWSAAGAGTEIDFRVPSVMAYLGVEVALWSRWRAFMRSAFARSGTASPPWG